MTQAEIRKAVAKQKKAMELAKDRLKAIQDSCKHPAVKKKHGSNTGNWCRQDDCYWTEFDCPDCDKRWTEEGSK